MNHADVPAERAVLAMIFLGGNLASTEVAGGDFTDPRRRAIWEAALALEEAGRPVDVITLEGKLAPGGLVTPEQIAQAAEPLCTIKAGHGKDYIARVIACSLRRGIAEVHKAGLLDTEEDPEIAASRAISLLQNASQMRGGALGVMPREGVLSAIESLKDRQGESYGLPTGLPTLDETLGGLGAGEVAVVSGITGTGKTSLVLQISDWLALHPTRPAPVLYFSGEMRADDLWQRVLGRRASVSIHEARQGITGDDLRSMFRAAEASKASRLIVSDDGMSLAKIEAKIRRFAIEQPGGLVVLDHLDHIETDAESQVQVVAKIMRRLKATALEARVPVILVAQFNRGFDGTRRPEIYDLKGGSAIEQYADSIWLLHTPDPVKAAHYVELLIRKNRRGPTGRCAMKFSKRYTRFTERDG